MDSGLGMRLTGQWLRNETGHWPGNETEWTVAWE